MSIDQNWTISRKSAIPWRLLMVTNRPRLWARSIPPRRLFTQSSIWANVANTRLKITQFPITKHCTWRKIHISHPCGINAFIPSVSGWATRPWSRAPLHPLDQKYTLIVVVTFLANHCSPVPLSLCSYTHVDVPLSLIILSITDLKLPLLPWPKITLIDVDTLLRITVFFSTVFSLFFLPLCPVHVGDCHCFWVGLSRAPFHPLDQCVF